MKRRADIITIVTLAVLFFAVAAANLFQTDRPTVSEEEKRDLAKFPALSVDAVADGSYFSDIELFVSDTFIGRDGLISAAKVMKLCYGLPAGENDAQFIPVSSTETQAIEIIVPEISDTEQETETLPAEEEEIIIPSGETTGEATTDEVTTDEVTTDEVTTDEETTTEVTTDAETTGEVTTDEETTGEVTTDAETTAEEKTLDTLTLSSADLYIAIGSSKDLSAYITPSDADIMIKWKNSNSNIAKIAALTDRLSVTGVAAGTATITATAGGLTAVCTVHVTVSIEPEEGDSSQIITEEPEILTSGMVIYKDAVYSIPYFVQSNAEYYAQTCEYYASLFKNSQMSVCIAPLSSAMLELDTFGKGRLTDQNEIINKIDALTDDTVNVVNPFDELWEHRDEYLYFKSDHHWTARGAYYAYKAFAESVGLEPVGLGDMKEMLLSTTFQGTMYSFTGDERVKKIYDSVYAYLPTKEHTMTIYKNGASTVYDCCILTQFGNYGVFIAGDNAYTVINVPDNPQDMNILVFKDSYGNAFVPYLCEHYGNIIVVDPRYVSFNVYELLKDYPLRDVLFMTNIYNPNVASWTLNLLRSVGAAN